MRMVPGRSAPRVRLVAACASAALALLLAGCWGSGPDGGAVATRSAGPTAVTGPLTVGGADFTEMRIMRAMYGLLLERAGFPVVQRSWPGREQYLPALEAGTAHVVPEYAATLAEFLNREVNGPGAPLVAAPDAQGTLARLRPLARERGLAVLSPARAANQNGFAVTSAFSRAKKVTSLSQLAALGRPVVLAATPQCGERPFCRPGLERVYGLTISAVLPLGFGTIEAKQAVIDGEAGLVLVGTTDGTLGPLGLRLLADDKKLQPADHLVPAVNAEAARDPRIAAALDPLSAVLTTADLARLNERVDGERRTPEGVAADYLTGKGLL